MQVPSIDPRDWTTNGNIDSFQMVAEVIQEQDEEMVKLTMESALQQFQTIGSPDSYNQIMPHASPSSNCIVTFQDWLPRDKPLCKVHS